MLGRFKRRAERLVERHESRGLRCTHLGMCRRTGLAQAIALLDWHSDPLIHRLDKFLRQRCRTRVQHAQCTEVVLIDHGMLAQQQHHGRNHVCKRDLVLLDVGAKAFDVEFGHDDQSPSAVEALVEETIQS